MEEVAAIRRTLDKYGSREQRRMAEVGGRAVLRSQAWLDVAGVQRCCFARGSRGLSWGQEQGPVWAIRVILCMLHGAGCGRRSLLQASTSSHPATTRCAGGRQGGAVCACGRGPAVQGRAG